MSLLPSFSQDILLTRCLSLPFFLFLSFSRYERKDDEEAATGEEAGYREESWPVTRPKHTKENEGRTCTDTFIRLYHGPDWRRQLPGADLRNLRLQLAIGPLPANRGHGRKKLREPITIIHDAIPIIDLKRKENTRSLSAQKYFHVSLHHYFEVCTEINKLLAMRHSEYRINLEISC